jgi:hypothetical protein
MAKVALANPRATDVSDFHVIAVKSPIGLLYIGSDGVEFVLD